jgi:hypothetical protein
MRLVSTKSNPHELIAAADSQTRGIATDAVSTQTSLTHCTSDHVSERRGMPLYAARIAAET